MLPITAKAASASGLFSPDGDQGFPGNARIAVTYTLTGKALEIAYEMICDQDTVFNLTNHAYFNLSGHQHPEQAMVHTLWFECHAVYPCR